MPDHRTHDKFSKRHRKQLIAMEAYLSRHHISPTRPVLDNTKFNNIDLNTLREKTTPEGDRITEEKVTSEVQHTRTDRGGEDHNRIRLDDDEQESELLLRDKSTSGRQLPQDYRENTSPKVSVRKSAVPEKRTASIAAGSNSPLGADGESLSAR